MSEFDWIGRYFAPLAFGAEGARGMQDDAALLPPLEAGLRWVVSKDAMAEGIHFLPSLSPERLARRLLRTNLSDMAAMGAQPQGCFLGLSLPPETTEDWVAAFAAGLKTDLQAFGLALWGGDMTAVPQGRVLSLTILGVAETPVSRRGARIGDWLAVTGSIGDAGLGLRIAREGRSDHPAQEDDWLRARYELPEPRVAMGRAAAGLAHAMMDISDGLAADVAKLCQASQVGAELQWDEVPLSAPLRRAVETGCYSREAAVIAGDDYELLLAVPEAHWAAMSAEAHRQGLPLTRIGRVTPATEGLVWRDAAGQPISVALGGFDHFSVA